MSEDLFAERNHRAKVEKLSKITGRHASICKIEPWLVNSTQEDAVKNGLLIRKSDQVKKMSGDRPLPCQIDDSTGESTRKIQILNKRFGEDSDVDKVIPFVVVCG